MQPVLIVGAGPVGLTTALGLAYYGIPFLIFEEDGSLSLDTKAGTILTRTLEAFRRYGVADAVLERALRVEEIGEIERETNVAHASVRTAVLREETRYPFVVNLPQHHLEPILREAVEQAPQGRLLMQHRLVSFRSEAGGVVAEFDTPHGRQCFEGSYLLACDGGRSTVRAQCGVPVDGVSLDVRYMLVDLKVDLDVANPRDYPYLAYFSDAQEWMILVRQPHCWRFLYPLAGDADEPTDEALRSKVLRFIGNVDKVELLGRVTYRVHHRIARQWRRERVFLMGDAAHLITPMWALGLNTGVLDAISLPWRLAWVLRGWADSSLLDGYEREQRPVAADGAGEMAEAARHHMAMQGQDNPAAAVHEWGHAYTRTLLGVRLDISGSGDWSMIRNEAEPPPLRVGERIPDFLLHGPAGRPVRLHDLVDDCFLALYFADVRRQPGIPHNTSPALRHFVVSRWDAPLDSGLRDRALLDVGNHLRDRLGVPDGTLVLVRPDDHVAAIVPIAAQRAEDLYASIVGARAPQGSST
ncbi:FAD-dependent monooxygenase [Cupriavidus sp. P-10]|uniref:FAD-dependent monooxygenase n=1 Tax=Cupriavidus sp. P-10 TaxID=2027911 RepID=UPI000E2E91FA|nr:FAD-dependent monooxygenase [Cupriavidus sp. P-10]BDB26301.1 FAD-dependent monooxygenase [Cupriavidus sp. P-10]